MPATKSCSNNGHWFHYNEACRDYVCVYCGYHYYKKLESCTACEEKELPLSSG